MEETGIEATTENVYTALFFRSAVILGLPSQVVNRYRTAKLSVKVGIPPECQDGLAL